jgi:peptide/nickel transport system permease protein
LPLIAIVFGILFGIISALHKDTWIDRLIVLCKHTGMSIPSFSVPFYLLGYLVCIAQIYKPEHDGSLYEVDDLAKEVILMENIILPAVVLGIRPLAVVIQLMRNSY